LSPTPRLADLTELAETVRASGTPVELRWRASIATEAGIAELKSFGTG